MRHGIHAHHEDLDALAAHGGLARLRELGFADVALAVNECGGRALLPWQGASAVRARREGVVYFNTRGDFGQLAPEPAPLLRAGEPSPLDRFCVAAGHAGVEARACLRPLRSASIGARFRHVCVVNAFGDRDAAALCPAQPPVLEFVEWLVDDLAAHEGLRCIELEGLGFGDPRHGAARLQGAIAPDAYLDFLLSVCFCTDCEAGMARTGLNVEKMRARVREFVSARMGTHDVLTPRRSGSNEETFRRLEEDLGHAAMFGLWSHRLATYLRMLKAVRRAVAGRTRIALHVHFHSLFSGDAVGAPLQVLRGHADELIVSHVDESPEALRAAWRSEPVRGHAVRAAIAPHPPLFRSADDVWMARSAVRDAGGAGLVVRSLGLLPWPTIERVAAVLRDGGVDADASTAPRSRAQHGRR